MFQILTKKQLLFSTKSTENLGFQHTIIDV